ncbi:MAG: Flp family type IVb pilin [Phycisphaerae bacterium]|jgi:pilus assembly protein Flp/PilA
MRIRAENLRFGLARWIRDEDGVTASEYAILLALIIIGSMAVIGSIGSKFAILYSTIAGALPAGF